MSAQTREAIDAAIRAHADDEWDGDMPTDWVVVSGLINVDGEHAVGIAASREPMPGYVATGLLVEGLRIGSEDDDE